MMEIEIVPSTAIHVQTLGKTLNAEDMEEATALGLKGHRALWRQWRNSMMRRSALLDGEVCAMWGVNGSPMGYIGTPWLVTSPKARTIPARQFSSIYRAQVREMLSHFPKLVNMVDDRYEASKRMLRIAGFNLDEPMPIGRMKRMFRRFWMEA